MSTVGRSPPSAERSGNQWIRMVVPSNDVRSKSDGARPGTATALVDCHPLGGGPPPPPPLSTLEPVDRAGWRRRGGATRNNEGQ